VTAIPLVLPQLDALLLPIFSSHSLRLSGVGVREVDLYPPHTDPSSYFFLQKRSVRPMQCSLKQILLAGPFSCAEFLVEHLTSLFGDK